MPQSDLKHAVTKIAVEIETKEGAVALCSLFISGQQRVSDLLNDERMFLPVEVADGSMVFLQKSSLTRVSLLQRIDLYQGHNPYLILGVSESISDQELKDTFRHIVRQSHPDRMQALELPAEFVDFANHRLARLNDAYRRILKQRTRAVETV